MRPVKQAELAAAASDGAARGSTACRERAVGGGFLQVARCSESRMTDACLAGVLRGGDEG